MDFHVSLLVKAPSEFDQLGVAWFNASFLPNARLLIS